MPGIYKTIRLIFNKLYYNLISSNERCPFQSKLVNLEGDEFSPAIVVFVPNVFGTAFTELLLVQSLCSECFWNSFCTVTQQHHIHCWSTLITPFEVVQAGVTLI